MAPMLPWTTLVWESNTIPSMRASARSASAQDSRTGSLVRSSSTIANQVFPLAKSAKVQAQRTRASMVAPAATRVKGGVSTWP